MSQHNRSVIVNQLNDSVDPNTQANQKVMVLSDESDSNFSDDQDDLGMNDDTFDQPGATSTIDKKRENILDSIIPPPNPLLPKSVAPEEPLKTVPGMQLLPHIILNGSSPASEPIGAVTDKTQIKQEDQYQGPETCLKQFFLLEYKTESVVPATANPNEENLSVQNTPPNPVVYSRFGKQSYYSEEKYHWKKFDEQKTNTLYVNVKQLIEGGGSPSNETIYQPNGQTKGFNKQSLTPYYSIKSRNDRTLIFESRFESGNLNLAIKSNDLSANKINEQLFQEYNLILQNDINTNGHTQWFYFRTENTTKGMKVKFNIINLNKPDSLYNYGMKVLVHSNNKSQQEDIGWFRAGENVAYFQNSFKKESTANKYYYTLTFTYVFDSDDDTVYFANCYPYTYSMLIKDLDYYEKDPKYSNIFSRNTLTRTLAGNKCEYITITSKDSPDQLKDRKGVIISARVHPGETNASFMMRGVIQFLLSDSPEAVVLREKFVFKVIPMINPDGVINGNYRCSLAGCDLNRRWKVPSKELHPTVTAIKRFAKNFSKERELALFCDLHGHSRRKNIFMYGNTGEDQIQYRLFPFLMSKMLDYFSFEYSRFSVHKSKESTARIALWRDLQIPNIFTMEASFCGANKGLLKNQHFSRESLEHSGKILCLALIPFYKIQIPQSLQEIADFKKEQMSNTYYNFQNLDIDQLKQDLLGNKKLIELGGKDEDSDGSDSEPSEDNLSENEIAKFVPIKKKRRVVKKIPKVGDKQKTQVEAQKKEEVKDAQTNKIKPNLKKNNTFFERMKMRGVKKVDMKDAWTQTSDREERKSSISGPNSPLRKIEKLDDQSFSRASGMDDPKHNRHYSPEFHLKRARLSSYHTRSNRSTNEVPNSVVQQERILTSQAKRKGSQNNSNSGNISIPFPSSIEESKEFPKMYQKYQPSGGVFQHPGRNLTQEKQKKHKTTRRALDSNATSEGSGDLDIIKGNKSYMSKKTIDINMSIGGSPKGKVGKTVFVYQNQQSQGKTYYNQQSTSLGRQVGAAIQERRSSNRGHAVPSTVQQSSTYTNPSKTQVTKKQEYFRPIGGASSAVPGMETEVLFGRFKAQQDHQKLVVKNKQKKQELAKSVRPYNAAQSFKMDSPLRQGYNMQKQMPNPGSGSNSANTSCIGKRGGSGDFFSFNMVDKRKDVQGVEQMKEVNVNSPFIVNNRMTIAGVHSTKHSKTSRRGAGSKIKGHSIVHGSPQQLPGSLRAVQNMQYLSTNIKKL